MRALIAEDDAALRGVLERGLREDGYVVDAVADGEMAARMLRSYEYAVAVLDWRMPHKAGIDVLDEVRRAGIRTPILMVTGLNRGADDYLVKPFDFSELLARLRALQRRPALALDPQLTCGDLRFEPSTRELHRGDEPVTLTATESALVELLLRRAPAVVSRRSIAVQVWDDEADTVGSNTIDVHMARLRAKLEGSRARIETIRGSGYRIIEQ
jgi:DNA-binding response OmpR family regulator